MKKILIIGTIALFVLGCADKLNTPTYVEVAQENAIKDLPNLLSGAYGLVGSANAIQNGAFLNDNGSFYGNDIIFLGDLLASDDYVHFSGTFTDYTDISRQFTAASNSIVFRVWRRSYKIINAANTILESPAINDYYKAQGLFLRAITHFELLKLWGQYKPGDFSGLGIPLMLNSTASFDKLTKPSRATVEQCFNSIIADLEAAKALLPGVTEAQMPSFGTELYANENIVKAYLARVYLQKGDYAAALTLADELVVGYSPAAVATAFNVEGAPGVNVLFAIPQTANNNAGTSNDGLTTFYGCDSENIPAGAGRGDVTIDSLFYSQYDSSDTRLTDLIYITDECGHYTSGKWKDPFAYIPVIRMEELILMRAECNQRLGSTVGATPLEDINTIRTRAGASLLASITLDSILHELELEFAFEGHRIHDLKRFGDPVALGNLKILPIPQAEINTNSSLKQNDDY